MDNFGPNLFKHLPERIFRPLGASEHAFRNWHLITHIYNDFFAPEADPPESEGWAQKLVLASIERFLVRWDENYEIDPEEQLTGLAVRAYSAFKYLIECEWLTLERVGFAQYVIMRPTVQSLFELLKTFAEQGPEFIGGRIQSIRNNLIQVLADPDANASVFQLAAKECSALLQMLNTTRMRVREASDLLRKQGTTNIFLERFFGDYISGLYIGDYSELFSKNHPLTARWEIIDLVFQITEEPVTRHKLRSWYRKNLRLPNNVVADECIEADARRVEALRSVDKLLSRLKDAVTKANDQALGYLEYKVRSQGDFNAWIDQTVYAITRTDESLQDVELLIPVGWSQGQLLNETLFKLPSAKPKQRKGAVIKKHTLTPEAQARRLIRRIMNGNRIVSEEKILAYIDRHMGEGEVLTTSEMKIESINDLCVLATFSRLGILAERAASNRTRKRGQSSTYPSLFNCVVMELTGDRFENTYLEAPVVNVRRLSKRKMGHAS